MHSSEDMSGSDYKMKIVELSWKELLLKWINDCVCLSRRIKKLNASVLVEVVNKYKDDICDNDVDRAILFRDDVEPFIKYKYPILRLRYLSDERDQPKKLYIMTSVILYHCCMNSTSGQVDRDICRNLTRTEQELILKFCEKLDDMEKTIFNVEYSVNEAYEAVMQFKKKGIHKQLLLKSQSSSSKSPSDSENPSSLSLKPLSPLGSVIKRPVASFNSSATVSLSSNVTDQSFPSSQVDLSLVNKMREMTDDFKAAACDGPGVRMKTFPRGNRRTKTDECYRTTAEERITLAAYNETPEIHECSEKMCCGSNEVCCSLADDLKEKQHCQNPRQPPPKFGKKCILITSVVVSLIIVLLVIAATLYMMLKPTQEKSETIEELESRRSEPKQIDRGKVERLAWVYKDGFCRKVTKDNSTAASNTFSSPAVCNLLKIRPQIWPAPTGLTAFGDQIVQFSVKGIEHKFRAIPSNEVRKHLVEAFELFRKDLEKLEASDVVVDEEEKAKSKNVLIIIDVDNDPDPRLKLITDESYSIVIKTYLDKVNVSINSASFCGVRHGLETLSQMILFDQTTGLLITLNSAEVNDAPNFRYRGLMIDTVRNYIPVHVLMRTIDAMSASKLNTFHWRISDVTSSSLLLPNIKKLFQFGTYKTGRVYTRELVTYLVKRASIRGIRVLIEVVATGQIGRTQAWSKDGYQSENATLNWDDQCLRMKINDVFDILQQVYTNIIHMTKVDDVFHLSDNLFPFTFCPMLIADKRSFLVKALDRLKVANMGVLPKLPIVWYTNQAKLSETKTWDLLGVQLAQWLPSDFKDMNRFIVIHSSRWDMSCEIEENRCVRYRTWQQMYSWKPWEMIEALDTEGGEAILWSDLVDAGNLDRHLWPRAAAVAERLWSNEVLNSTATPKVYARLDTHMWRLQLRDVNFQPIWPAWCSFNPGECAEKIKQRT